MIKRAFDLVSALAGLILLLPFLCLIALVLKFYEGDSVFFVQSRIGLGGRSFRMFKFRSMIRGAERAGPALTIGHDSRVTPLGRLLRRYKLDELPQLFNVVLGDMSLVGPRPEVEKFVREYSEAQRAVLHLKPGITDPASFAFFDESELLGRVADPDRFYRDQLVPEKIRVNLEYARRATFGTDLVLILATIARAVGVKFDVFQWLSIARPKIRAADPANTPRPVK